jgi:hypothetical protein
MTREADRDWNLDISGTEITVIPSDAKIGGKIIGLPRRTV